MYEFLKENDQHATSFTNKNQHKTNSTDKNQHATGLVSKISFTGRKIHVQFSQREKLRCNKFHKINQFHEERN